MAQRWLVPGAGVCLLMLVHGLLFWEAWSLNLMDAVPAVEGPPSLEWSKKREDVSASPSGGLQSSSEIFRTGFSFTDATNELLLRPERQWTPSETAQHHLCIIVPFRESPSSDEANNGANRSAHLAEFLPYMRQWMKKQGVSFTFVIAEQENGLLFNRGALLNLGFLVSYHLCDYAVFHDVDFLPINEGNTYAFPKGPTHRSEERRVGKEC